MRFKKSFKNFAVSWIGQILYTVSIFIARSIFINQLGSEYMGISGLFTNILSLLSLAELGLASAISYALYKPIHEQDQEKIKSYIMVFRKSYIVIGGIILALGIALAPFIQYLVNTESVTVVIGELRIYFVLYVINVAISYFGSAKSILVTADQKNYVINLNYYFWNIGCLIFQSIYLFISKNFTVYLIIQIIFTVCQNLLINYITNRMYPYLKEKSVVLSREEIVDLWKYIRATIYHKVGGVMVNSTDNIIISKFLGLLSVGLVANYNMIINTINTFLGKIYVSISASIGNYSVATSKKETCKLFEKVNFMGFWLYSFSSTALYCLLTPFVSIWLGEGYTVENKIVAIICLNFFIKGLRQSILTFRDSMGLFVHDRYKPLLESACNLVVSIVLVQFMGLLGVFLGTLVTYILVDLPIEPYILYRKGFGQPLHKYFSQYGAYILVTLVNYVVTTNLITIVAIENVLFRFLSQCVIVALVPNLIIVLCFRNTEAFKYLLEKVKQISRKN